MAVIQISRVQHRRGLLQDLPQLSAAELGWVIDNRKLYIGNGPIEEGAPIVGNTEILTQYSDILGGISSYTYKGTETGYTAQTQSGSGNVQRTLQSKLDDVVSAKDFGIVGDGTTDMAAKINWMLFQVYCRESSNSKSLKRILFPAGTYIVKSAIKIPSDAVIIGEGAEHTIFKYNGSTVDYVARTADSAQQTGTNIGLSGATFPENISIAQCSFENTTAYPAILIERAKYVHCDDVTFTGNHANDDTYPSTSTASVGVKVSKETTDESYHITFNRCNYRRASKAFVIDTEVNNVVLDKCNFHLLYQGVVVGENIIGNGPAGVKVNNCLFDDIHHSAVKVFSVKDFVSSFNTFKVMTASGVAGAGGPLAPVIDINSDNNYSIGDSFERNDADAATHARIETNNKRVYGLVAGEHIVYGTHYQQPGVLSTLVDNTSVATTTGIDFDESVVTNHRVYFTINRGQTCATGVLTVTGSNTSGYSLDEERIENADVGVGFGIDVTTGTIQYTSTSTGTAPSLHYRIETLK
jgi:hypothetical protein